VLELAEMQSSGDPFSETSGFTGAHTNGATSSDPFGLPPIKEAAPASADFEDEIPF